MRWITTQQAADILNLAQYHSVIKLIKQDKLKAKKFGDIWMVSKKSVLDRNARLTALQK